MISFLKIIYKKIFIEIKVLLQFGITEEEINKVFNFFSNYNGLRTSLACANITGISQSKCEKIKRKLYKQRKLGFYFFEAGIPPQKYMKDYIIKKFNQINFSSKIVELGPGEFPVFDYKEYKNWIGVDKNYDGRQINFKELEWSLNKYPTNKIINGGFENLTQCLDKISLVGKVDLVVASHVFEHTLIPIKSLIEANKILCSGGLLILFVPDGFSDDAISKDPTHTLYLNKAMIEEFFFYAGGYYNLEIRAFRPNADLVVTAIKI